MKSFVICLFLVSIVNCADVKIPSIKLNSGHDMPLLGCGAWKSSPSEAYTMVKEAIEVGYRYIDTAFVYHNEHDTGKAINEMIEKGTVKREELFVTSKVWPHRDSKEDALQGVKDCLKKMNLKYLDLMLIHTPRAGYHKTWEGLEEAVHEGLVKSIGISNFNEHQVDDLLKTAKIHPAVNQIQSHPYHTQDSLVKHCHAKHIDVTAYSPLGQGGLLSDKEINKIAKAHHHSAAQVMLRFQVQRKVVALTSSHNKDHLIENTKIFDFELADADMKEINSMRK